MLCIYCYELWYVSVYSVIEYDVYLEEQKVELAAKPLQNNEDIVILRRHEREVDQNDQEVKR